jgi:negative regulator of replication initiation
MRAEDKDIAELLEAHTAYLEAMKALGEANADALRAALRLTSLTSSQSSRKAYLQWADENITEPVKRKAVQEVRNLLINTTH